MTFSRKLTLAAIVTLLVILLPITAHAAPYGKSTIIDLGGGPNYGGVYSERWDVAVTSVAPDANCDVQSAYVFFANFVDIAYTGNYWLEIGTGHHLCRDFAGILVDAMFWYGFICHPTWGCTYAFINPVGAITWQSMKIVTENCVGCWYWYIGTTPITSMGLPPQNWGRQIEVGVDSQDYGATFAAAPPGNCFCHIQTKMQWAGWQDAGPDAMSPHVFPTPRMYGSIAAIGPPSTDFHAQER